MAWPTQAAILAGYSPRDADSRGVKLVKMLKEHVSTALGTQLSMQPMSVSDWTKAEDKTADKKQAVALTDPALAKLKRVCDEIDCLCTLSASKNPRLPANRHKTGILV